MHHKFILEIEVLNKTMKVVYFLLKYSSLDERTFGHQKVHNLIFINHLHKNLAKQ
jgi:hypothetical protein